MVDRIQKALEVATMGTIDGAHHKTWVIDQMVRALTGCSGPQGVMQSEEYIKWVADLCDGEEGPSTYEWDVGIPP